MAEHDTQKQARIIHTPAAAQLAAGAPPERASDHDSAPHASGHAGAWRAGFQALAQARYWDAHERWEDCWRALDTGPDREAVQALIQCAACAYKLQQTLRGRPRAGMQRGQARLLASARAHLEAARRALDPAEAPDWWARLGALLDALEGLHARWRAGLTEAECLAEAARHCAQLEAPAWERALSPRPGGPA